MAERDGLEAFLTEFGRAAGLSDLALGADELLSGDDGSGQSVNEDSYVSKLFNAKLMAEARAEAPFG